MDYLDFYGLEQEPFSSAPVSKFYYNSAQHQRALVRLMYAVDTMKGLAVLIGELGTGKTTLARRMLDNLPEEEYESALLVIIHSGITADWLLSRIARQLGVEDPAPEKLKLLNQLYSRLVELHEQGKKAVVLIDEAQMLHTREIMEEFRGLLNLEVPESKLINFVFFGLPEFEEYLHLDEPLAQRVALKCKLESFNLESTDGYITHRLRLAGAKAQLFHSEAAKLIHHYSRGIPRLINTICDNSLFEGYLLKKKFVEPDLVQAVAMDLGLAAMPKTARRPQRGGPADVLRGPGAGRVQDPRQPPPGRRPVKAQPAYEQEYEDDEFPEGVSIEPAEDSDTEVDMGLAARRQPSIGRGYDMEPEPVTEAEAYEVPAIPPVPTEPPPEFEPAPSAGARTRANPDDIDAMFNGLTDKPEPKKQGREDDAIDEMLDDLEDK